MIEILKSSDALLEGHFLLTSGKHSNRYVQCAKVLRYPDKAQQILKPVAEKLRELNIDLLVGPAMGGIIDSLGKNRFFAKLSAEFVCDDDAAHRWSYE